MENAAEHGKTSRGWPRRACDSGIAAFEIALGDE